MVKVRAIALTAWHEALRRRVFYFFIIAVVVNIGGIVASLPGVIAAGMAGETEAVHQAHASFVANTLGVWRFILTCLALFLGSIAVSSEVSGKTIVNVLSRPVDRAAYLLGRWLGTAAFLGAFTVIGVLIAAAIALIFQVHWPLLAWFAVIEILVAAIL